MKVNAKDFLNGFLVFSLLICGVAYAEQHEEMAPEPPQDELQQEELQQAASGEGQANSPAPQQNTREIAVFAGGCFWCMEKPFDETPGVFDTTSGYTGGNTINPTYAEVTGKSTGHFEAIQITYDTSRVTYDQLLEVFWRNIDPLDGKGQFCDKGPQYRSAIFVADEKEEEAAKASLAKIAEKLQEKGKVVTEILPLKEFYKAEEYHQNYYQKNKLRYKYYRHACGRDKRLEELWGPSF